MRDNFEMDPSEAASRYFAVEVRRYGKPIQFFLWLIVLLPFGGSYRFAPGRVCLVRKSDRSVVYSKTSIDRNKIAALKEALEEEIASSSALQIATEYHVT
jgi:hypothetical protein